MSFRSVCKWWRVDTPISDHPPRFPLLLEREFILSSRFNVYSVHTGQTQRMRVPEAFDKELSRQSRGYLYAYELYTVDDDSTPPVLNQFKRVKVHLGSFGIFYYFRPLHIGSESSDPIQNPDGMVIYTRSIDGCRCMGFRRSQEDRCALQSNMPCRVKAYHRGRLFLNNSSENSTTVKDLITGNQFEVKLPSNKIPDDFSCLGEGAGGTMLGIQRRFHSHNKYDVVLLKKCWFEVYHLDEKQNPPRWVKLSDIGDLMIFLNSDNSGFCLSAGNCSGVKGNCIYFTRWNGKENHDSQMLIGRYELGGHRSEEIGRVGSQGMWVVPYLL